MEPRQMLRRITQVALCLAAVSPAARASTASTHERLPFQQDFDRCTLAAEDRGIGNKLQGRLRLELLLRKEGNVYAAFVHSEAGIDDRKFERCLTDRATLWVLPPVSVDYERAYVVTFTPGGDQIDFSAGSYGGGSNPYLAGRASAFMPAINDPVPYAPIEEKVARDTLSVADWATESERAVAWLTVHQYPEALKSAGKGLVDDSTDPIALRALAETLAESNGDLALARATAERLVSLYPQMEASHEALLRVCLASGDDECAFAQYRAAHQSADLQPRSRLLAELTEPTRNAADRLRARVGLKSAADPCASEPGEVAQALCVVKRCLDEGSATYAKELAEQDHAPYLAGDWRLKEVSKDRLLVTRPISAQGAARHDALWVVKLGDVLTMVPSNPEARQITLRHNRCGARSLGSR